MIYSRCGWADDLKQDVTLKIYFSVRNYQSIQPTYVTSPREKHFPDDAGKLENWGSAMKYLKMQTSALQVGWLKRRDHATG